MEKLVVCTCHRIKIGSQDTFQDNFFLRNVSPMWIGWRMSHWTLLYCSRFPMQELEDDDEDDDDEDSDEESEED